jgi:hypothetical protein
MTTPAISDRAVSSMSALARPVSAEDEDVERAAGPDIAALTDPTGAPTEADLPGQIAEGSFRVLASPGGRWGGEMFAFRTDRGRVCGGLLGAAAGCFEGFHAGGLVNWTIARAEDGTTIVFGFAPDRVRGVSAIVGDSARDTPVVNNSFYLEIDGTPLTALVVRLVDGGQERIPLHLQQRWVGPSLARVAQTIDRQLTAATARARGRSRRTHRVRAGPRETRPCAAPSG